MNELRIAVVDDDPILLVELPALLNKEGITVVWTAASGDRALRNLGAGSLPDVLVVDVRMPGLSGHELASTVNALHPSLPIVMYTSIDSGSSLRDALECGARGYVVKHDPPARIALLLRLAQAGQLAFSESPGRRLAEDFTAREPVVAPLTERQREVLRLASLGTSNEAIARRLGCTLDTVKKHLTAIFTGLGASDRASAVAIAIHSGIL